MAVVQLHDFGHAGSRLAAQRFVIQQITANAPFSITSASEWLLVAAEAMGTLAWGNVSYPFARSQVVLVPPGAATTTLASGAAYALTPRQGQQSRGDAPSYERRSGPNLQIFDMNALPAPADNPRLKMIQTADMSINWVLYAGPRDRSRLSPHWHQTYEQGSLAIRGRFIHHLRHPWGMDADLWQVDQHMQAGPGSALVIPPLVTHTSEGVGEGEHLLIDVFSPPRADFRNKGWIANAHDYGATQIDQEPLY